MLVASGVAMAQAGFIIEVDYGPGQVELGPGNPSCTIRISATFSPPDFAFGAARLVPLILGPLLWRRRR